MHLLVVKLALNTTFGPWSVVFLPSLVIKKVSSFAKEEGLHYNMHTTKFVPCCDLVPNMVVDFKILNFCLFTCLFVSHVLPISQEENGPIIIPKTVLKSGL